MLSGGFPSPAALASALAAVLLLHGFVVPPPAAAGGARAAASCAAPAHPLIAEILYDAVGDDTGWEFVELYNPTGRALPLAGARLEAGDGSTAGRWTLRWTGNAGDSVPARGRFVIGGARVLPAPQAVVTLELQNGPDAVRVRWPDGTSEVVGYGGQEFAEYSCGTPAVDVASGQSLARVPDDADLGANALDFRAAAPSPGRANQAARDLGVVRGTLALAPERPDPGAAATLGGRLVNTGASSLGAGEGTLTARARADGVPPQTLASAASPALAPGDSADFAVPITLDAGRWCLEVAVALGGDEESANDLDTLLARCGPGPLEVTEIQFHPAAGEGEWVEVRARGSAAVEVAGFRLADRGSARGVPVGGADPLAPESLAVLAQDRAALLRAFPALDSLRVWVVRPWSSLNNTNDSTGIADEVVLREADGTLCERVAYSAAGVPAGTPLELRDGAWWPAYEVAGTPLRPPAERAPLGRRFACAPRRVRAGGEGRLAWELPWTRARVSLDLYDLEGRRVARPLAEFVAPGRGERAWSPGALPGGLYVAVARARPDGTGETVVESLPVRIEGAPR